MSIGDPEEPVLYNYRSADPYFAQMHLLGAKRRIHWIDQQDRDSQETLDLALEADAAAAEACLALDHERHMVTLNSLQRQALEDCVYALNRLSMEVQCTLTRVEPIAAVPMPYLVAYLLFWRSYQPVCFRALRLPPSMRVCTDRARLKKWQPPSKRVTEIEDRYMSMMGQRLY